MGECGPRFIAPVLIVSLAPTSVLDQTAIVPSVVKGGSDAQIDVRRNFNRNDGRHDRVGYTWRGGFREG